MRCIETSKERGEQDGHGTFNKNMRCIETRKIRGRITPGRKFNKNMRCIETTKHLFGVLVLEGLIRT